MSDLVFSREAVRLTPDPETPGDFSASRDGWHLGHVCTHGDNGWVRVGFDWGQKLQIFPTLDDAVEFLSKLKAEP